MLVKTVAKDKNKKTYDVFVGHGWGNRVRVTVTYGRSSNAVEILDSSVESSPALLASLTKQFNHVRRVK